MSEPLPDLTIDYDHPAKGITPRQCNVCHGIWYPLAGDECPYCNEGEEK